MKDLDKLNLKDKKYIIFDMDGTLIDSIGVWNRTDQKLIEEYTGIEVVNIYDKYADIDRNKISLITDYSIENYREFINLVERIYENLAKVKVRS